MTDLEAAAERLLKGEFDVNVLDQIMAAAYDPISPHRSAANKTLMQLQEAPDIWTKADAIIESAANAQSRFFGLQILDDAIRTRWVNQWFFPFSLAVPFTEGQSFVHFLSGSSL